MIGIENTKYEVKGTSKFKKQLKKAVKQVKDVNKLITVLNVLANGETLEEKYNNHKLINNNYYKNCLECYIEPDWLLIYKYNNDQLLLILLGTGSHSELFDK